MQYATMASGKEKKCSRTVVLTCHRNTMKYDMCTVTRGVDGSPSARIVGDACYGIKREYVVCLDSASRNVSWCHVCYLQSKEVVGSCRQNMSFSFIPRPSRVERGGVWYEPNMNLHMHDEGLDLKSLASVP